MNYTSTIDTTDIDPYDLKNKINILQSKRIKYSEREKTLNVLFNKGRYFEMTISDNKLIASISKAIKVKIEFGDMICAGKHKLEALAVALNKRNIYLNITIDWI